jgi:hypothetical protein
MPRGKRLRSWLKQLDHVDLPRDRNLWRHGPHASGQLTGHRHRDDVRVLASGNQASGACTAPALSFPPHVLNDFGWGFQAQLQMAPDFGGMAGGPGALDQRPSGLGSAGGGNGTLSASLASGGCRGDEPQAFQQCSGGAKRVRSPIAAPMVTAAMKGTPRRA